MRLLPSQEAALQTLQAALRSGDVAVLFAASGRGKTTVLRHLHMQTGGAYITGRDYLDHSSRRHPLALEESLFFAVSAALDQHEYVYVDDIDLIQEATSSCHYYPRGNYLETALRELAGSALRHRRKLIVSSDHHIAPSFLARAFSASINRFSPEDYSALLENVAGAEQRARLEIERIYRFAPKLNAHQLRAACDWLAAAGPFTTEQFIEYLRSRRLASNVDLSEVREVDLSELQGVDDVIRNLEIHIALPLENDQLAAELGLRPKRGVLLYGPPGTGKTTVGRALAHRLRGKFLMIDGTFIAGSHDFYSRVHQVFEAAKDNAPSVIFIDDADAIFEDGEERGLYRYLLTMLDGLESESAGRVCVMMTAMNLNHLPPALVRSGRVELWLEMRLPDEAARLRILTDLSSRLPGDLDNLDHQALADATGGFTGADLRRLVEDSKALYAFDRVRNAPLRHSTDYFIEAVGQVRDNKGRYQAAQDASQSRSQQGNRIPSYYYPPPHIDE